MLFGLVNVMEKEPGSTKAESGHGKQSSKGVLRGVWRLRKVPEVFEEIRDSRNTQSSVGCWGT